jgi:hypothetical protein
MWGSRAPSKGDNLMADVELPTQFSHSVKIEQTAKGARVTVHVSANTFRSAMYEAVELYSQTRSSLLDHGVELAPIEVKANGKESSV